MHLLKIEISNYRGLTSKDYKGDTVAFQSVLFDQSFNVIIGVNGIGKTSILDAIATLLLRVLPYATLAPSRKRHFIPTDFRLQDEEINARIWIDFEPDAITYGIAQTIEPQRKPTEELDKAQLKSIASRHDKTNPTSQVNTPIALLYTTDRAGYRLARKAATTAPPGRAAAYQGALTEKMVNYGSVALWLRKHRGLADESERDRYILDTTEAAVRRFLPAFGELEEQTDPPRLFVKKRGVRLGIEQLSDGERSFLAMVVDIARHLALANPASSDPLSEGKGVVLIDELELHLHPEWQRSVVEQLQKTFPELQFIATTHSPFVVQSLQPGQLINLDPESSVEEYVNQSIEDISEGVMGVYMPQKSKRYLDMIKIAEQYYQTLAQAQEADGDELEALKQELDRLSIPYSDDPAFTAFLKFQRESALHEHETNQQGDSST